ncbi:MAG TPA: carboxypeptidase-like regulatory domain-containing protein [Gaiellaceae bacterium]|nr:carboxypeptidase-like regulatory domain-containing protein [Gaiellaceae bacterium]
MRRQSLLVVAFLACAAAAGAGAAAGSSTRWTRINGPGHAGIQLGLARTPDGVLHVIWNRGNPPPTAIYDTRFSPSGVRTGTSTVATGWGGAGGLALLAMPDGTLRLFASGDHSSATSNGGISTFTAPASGVSWTLQPDVWGGPVAGAAGIVAATLTKDGQVVTGWRGFAAEGVPPSSVPQSAYIAFNLASRLATDASSGAVVIEGTTGAGKGGVFVRQILPSAGPAVVLPDGSYNNDWIAGLSGRIRAPGVYVAYADTKAVHLYRYGGGSRTLARGPFTSATVCAAPDGRLWLAWGDAKDGIFVTRTSRAAGVLEPTQKLAVPSSAGLAFLQCEGSGGPLDLFADAGPGGTGFWHTHVLARLSPSARVVRTKAGGAVTIAVRDAGDPVAGARVAVGAKRLTTNAKGQAQVSLRPGSYSASVTAPGYAAATVRFRV